MQCENPKILSHLPHIIDTGETMNRTLEIGKNECQKYVFIPENDGIYERHFILREGSIFRGGAIVLWANMVLKMYVSIEWSSAEGSLQLLGLAKSWSNIEIDGVGRVLPGAQNVKLRIDQTNILLGIGARVRWKPVLEVETDSVEWGHSCKVHRISWDNLFYLESHGIDAKTAEWILLEGEIRKHMNIVDRENEVYIEKILEDIT